MSDPALEPRTFPRLRIGCFIDASVTAVNGIVPRYPFGLIDLLGEKSSRSDDFVPEFLLYGIKRGVQLALL